MTHVDSAFQSPATLVFCPGLGGLEEGFEQVVGQARYVALVEIESVIATNLVAKMEARLLAPTPIWTDVKTFNPRPFRGKVHWIIAGYPCTPFSVAGKRKGDRDPRHLWPFIRRAIETIRPVCVFLENVDDHLTLGFEEVSRDLRKMGYLVEAGVYSAEEAGAPHERQRLFVLAIDRRYRSILANSAIKGLQKSTRSESEQRQQADPQLANANLCRQQQWQFTRVGRTQESVSLSNASVTRSQRTGCTEPSGNGRTSGFHHWPAGPGDKQYEWEPPRTKQSPIKCKLGSEIDGISNRENLVFIEYAEQKERAIKALHELWCYINSKEVQWTFGGLFGFLKEKILFSKVYGLVQNQRLSNIASVPEKILSITEKEMRDLWFKEIVKHPPQGQECLQQLRKEFADAMCILSYQITLARRQEREARNSDKAMQNLWESLENTWWDVPETLSEIQTAWKPLSEKSHWKRQAANAYQGYRLDVMDYFREDILRALGNACVPDQAAIALRDLLRKHFE